MDIKHHKYFRYSLGKSNFGEIKPTEIAFEKLKTQKINSKGKFIPEAYHNAVPGLTIADNLYDIYEFWAKQQNVLYFNKSEFNKVENFKQEVKNHYGDNISLSLGAINGIANAFYNKQEYAKSIEAWNILLDYYPNFSQAYLNIIKAKKKLNIDIQKTIIDFKTSLKKSKLYSQEQKTEMLRSLE
ncbi:hypothetical protein [uncultured Lacinutrix sp.]|uniref:hypothetical protein n=1 Tax=uncultured Lacinutrix sp. TaxID=574032 RepID=UPI00260F3A23|nr:hypothetical protein [uncultured Lacinutrix sp.]